MRIAVVTGVFPAWSVTFILDQITYALDHGCEVDVYASRPGVGTEHAEVSQYGLAERIHYFPRSRVGLAKWRRSALTWASLARHPRTLLRALPHARSRHQLEDLAAFLPRREYDVVHCHFAPNGERVLPALEAGVLRGKQLVTFHGYDVLKAKPGAFARLFASRAYYTANTRFLAERAVALGCPEERIVDFPMGVNTSLFQPPAEAREPAGLTLLTVARLVEFKGIEYGIRAFARLAPRFPELDYEIVGDGPLRRELEALCRELGVAERVQFRGAADRQGVRAALARASVFVLPGVFDAQGQCEAQGVVLVEAQASGVPIVASRIGGIPEAVGEHSGLLVEPRDVEGLSAALETLLKDPEQRRKMQQAGPRFVAEKFDQQRLNARLLAIYECVARGRHPSGATAGG